MGGFGFCPLSLLFVFIWGNDCVSLPIVWIHFGKHDHNTVNRMEAHEYVGLIEMSGLHPDN